MSTAAVAPGWEQRGLLVIEQRRPRSFEPEFNISVACGGLLALGVRVRRARVQIRPEDVLAERRVLPPEAAANLAEFVRAAPTTHVLILRTYYEDVAAVITAAAPGVKVTQTDASTMPFPEEIARWMDGAPRWLDATDADIGVRTNRLHNMLREHPDHLQLALTDLMPAPDRQGFDGDFFLDNLCYYRAPYTEGRYPALEGTASCTFCDIAQPDRRQQKPDPQWLAPQIAAYMRDRPMARVFHLVDAGVLSHVDQVAEVVAREATHPIEVCIDIRVPDILRNRPRIEAALGILEQGGHVLNFYCTGFETFSPTEFSRLNKGYPVHQNVECLLYFDELSRRFPRSFESTRLSAHGFINFTPWTRADDLLRNAFFARALGFRRWCNHWYLRKLRIYDSLPIARLAEADGVFIEESYEDPRYDNARWALYRNERRWRFLDETTARIARHTYRLLLPQDQVEQDASSALQAALNPRFGDDWEVMAFAAIIHAVEAQGSGPDEDDRTFAARAIRAALLPESDLLPARRALGLPTSYQAIPEPSPFGTEAHIEVQLATVGIKPAAKIELLPGDDVGALRGWLQEHGMTTTDITASVAPNRGKSGAEAAAACPVLVTGRDPRDVERLVALIGSGPAEFSTAGILETGALLGYPPCCVEAYAKRLETSHDDIGQMAAAVADTKGPVHPSLDPWAWWRGIEYVPCSLDCAASIARVERALSLGVPIASDERRFYAQLLVTRETRLVLEGATRVEHGYAYTGVQQLDRDPLATRYLESLRQGDQVLFMPTLMLVMKAGRMQDALPHDVVVPWLPCEAPDVARTFSWLGSARDRRRRGEMPASIDHWERESQGGQAEDTGRRRIASAVPVPRIVYPTAPDARAKSRFEAACAQVGQSIRETTDADGHGRALVFDDGEFVFFRGEVDTTGVALRVRIGELSHHYLPRSSRHVHLQPFLRPGRDLVLTRQPMARNGAQVWLGDECDLVEFALQ